MDYTIHNVNDSLDAAIQERAREESKSVNVVLLEALTRGLSSKPSAPVAGELADIFPGVPLEPEVLKAIGDQRRVEPEIWQ
ncbi:hypothetical protein [Aeoliella mucimassa]|uniref:Uncharacterized protein n=1 Tax=Aeoliella mucimassa TaxID=2527972 RepID=A0A518AT90_9BACT|nr:hypothetical protein [Aeoliella mucimassa]QDU57907.1 hypothetical protein Pan181_41300 [Aeoliella mucimassa]